MPPKRRTARRSTPVSPDTDDLLGKLLHVYRPNLSGCLLVSGLGLIVAVMVVVFAAILIGGVIAVAIAAMIAAAVFIGSLIYSAINYNQRLEFHQGGLRFTKGRSVTEIAWDEILDMQVGRTNLAGYGPVQMISRADDPEGDEMNWYPIRRAAFWEISIIDHAGQSIQLNQMFMAGIRDPRKLIQNLRKGSGLERRAASTR